MAFDDFSEPETLGMSRERLDRIPEFYRKNYLDTKKLPNISTLVARGGEVVHLSCQGVKDWDTGEPVTADTIYRIYSMTKPVTSVAAMMCFEEGLLRLEHPVSRYIPSFKKLKVWKGGTADAPELVDCEQEMMVKDLFLHTSGLTYDFLGLHPVEKLYIDKKVIRKNHSLADMCEMLSDIPLLFQPGTRWNYSVAIDVLGHLVEIVSGQSLDEFFRTRIFEPLGMVDTGFTIPTSKLDRFASCYARNPLTKEITLADKGDETSSYCREGKDPQRLLSGGGGLVSTLSDYLNFCRMLAGGGELNDVRLLSPKTVEYMMSNHLPGGSTMGGMGDEMFSESNMAGNGFGLGGAVVVDPILMNQPSSEGTFSWGGLASTFFWIDPEEDMIGIQMTQMIPSSSYPIRPQFQQLAYASIIV
ncbi:serine hydrolase [Ponticaulis sp.]|uniref:serine hydrolase domain-containing protein n=1 Tax=Ponticaulis sp. TaxID=2020902 RepID=UPI0025DFC288|nr:serine hydrolase domain-containing protein [Ponticaulis sp.]|tara:strand:+ start:38193 stop:39437 length:1245 start_codon:yes stop_codon:yes gene_type:complete